MKLPRYLQVAIIVTAGLVIWSQFSGDEPAESTTASRPIAQRTRPAAVTSTTAAPTTKEWVNLFPGPAKPVTRNGSESLAPPPPAPSAPPLPFKAMGAWWSKQQRVVIVTDGQQTWPVCNKCDAEGKIWIGSSPMEGWSLVEVADDHLLFEWLATHTRKRLELGDLQDKPTR